MPRYDWYFSQAYIGKKPFFKMRDGSPLLPSDTICKVCFIKLCLWTVKKTQDCFGCLCVY